MTLPRRRAKRHGFHPGTFPLLDYASRPPLAFPAPRGDWRVRHLTNRFGAPTHAVRAYLDVLDAIGGAQ